MIHPLQRIAAIAIACWVGSVNGQQEERVSYAAEFFAAYNPITARDMLLQVPGFRLEEGGTARGFGGTAGNVLIDGARPSTKNDDAGEILGRIPANQVLRVDLIRGDTGGLNLRGQTVVADVILRPDSLPSGRWEGRIRTTKNTDLINPVASVSGTRYLGSMRLTMGFDASEDRAQQARGIEWLSSPTGLLEERYELADSAGETTAVNFNTERRLGATTWRLNGRIGNRVLTEAENSARTALADGYTSRTVLEDESDDTDTLELGADAEFAVATNLGAKAIVVFNDSDKAVAATLRQLDPEGSLQSLLRSDLSAEEEELLVRTELDWSRWAGHGVEINVEIARNELISRAALTRDTGQGPQPQPLPGGNTDVDELRWEIDAADTWQAGTLAIEAGLAFESSTITQRGDAEQERTFTFLKPRLQLSRVTDQSRQLRLRIQREVAQLDFNDFASFTNFADNQLALGNPDLKPDNTWVTELSWEQRFGEIGVFSPMVFHHWIDDVLDILPVGGIAEVPGNIGSGRRWGIESMLTFSLQQFGVPGVRIDMRGRWEDSEVTDPVTGQKRNLSNRIRRELQLDFRHNIESTTWAWGGMIATSSDDPFFGLDEYVAVDDVAGTLDADLFVETTRWFGVRLRLQAGNVFNRRFERDRLVWSGPRELTPLLFSESRSRTRGHSVELSATGSF
jgi:outer membrane receptor protein involved in Fe transport